MLDFKFLKIFKTPTKEILEILNNNIIGTPGQGMLYQHLRVQNKIEKIAEPFYVNLIRNYKIMGTCCFCRRSTINAGLKLPSFYIRYFSFKDIFRRKFLSKKTTSRNSILRSEIKKLLCGIGLEKKVEDPFFHYAYVDPRNLRSSLLCKEFGFTSVRQFSTIIFNRLYPKFDSRVTLVSPDQEEKLLHLIRNFYKGYTMFSDENIFNGRSYYIIKNSEGDILAGVGVSPDNWKIHSMPGFIGKIILNGFSIIPILKKLFNKNFRFLTFEAVYHAPGNEKLLEVLFESLLAKYKVNSAMIWADSGSELYKALKSLDLGIVDKLNKEVHADVICRFNYLSEEHMKVFFRSPAYISGIDLT